MKKEEFPTFLNEQPTIIFNRTGRELLIITIGLAVAYVVWGDLGHWIPGSSLALGILKGLIASIFALAGVIIAFIKVASRPLEEWAFIGLFYLLIPKVYIYMSTEESVDPANQSDMRSLDRILSRTDEDDYADD